MDCNIEQDIFVTKLNLDSRSLIAKICFNPTTNKSCLFSIQVFSDDQSWSGNLSYEEADAFRDHLEEDINEYSRNVKYALKGTGRLYKFEFTTNNGNAHKAKFTWKRTFTGSTATLVHGFVNLQRDEPIQCKDNVIDFLLKENKTLLNKITELENTKKILSEMVDNSNSELEKYVNIKESLESNLYGKFVEILNSKKRRIAVLKDHIANIEHADN